MPCGWAERTGEGGRGTKKEGPPGNSWEGGGGVPPGQILTVFQTKKCHFPQPFSDLSKIYSRIQTWPTDIDDVYMCQEN